MKKKLNIRNATNKFWACHIVQSKMKTAFLFTNISGISQFFTLTRTSACGIFLSTFPEYSDDYNERFLMTMYAVR